MTMYAKLALVVALLAPSAADAAPPYTAQCREADNVIAIHRARARVSERCDCTGAASAGAYAKCVKREASGAAGEAGLPRPCRRVVVDFERRSACGKRGLAVCCRATAKGGVKAGLATPARCARRGGNACPCAAGDGLCARSVFEACTPAGTCAGLTDAAGPAPVRSHLLPSSDVMLGWIERIFAQGVRRPGYPADEWIEQWAAERFAEIGLEDVHLDPIDVLRWLPNRCALALWPAGRPAERSELPCFPVPFSTPTAGLTGALGRIADAGGVAGRIAVVDNPFLRLPQSLMVTFFSTDYYEPDPDFLLEQQTLPFSLSLQHVMEPAIEAGATGFIGIIGNLPWDTDRYFVPYDAVRRPIPGVWLSAANGAAVKAMLASGPVEAEIVLDAEVGPAVSHNVIGTLPGASPEWVVIGSHHDGPWASAVEDASGVALVLAQALYWAQVPAAQRPHNLLFVLNGGHMSGGAGLIAFIERNADWLDQIVLEVHLEHVAREARGENGVPVPTDRPEPRWWFTSRIPALQAAVKETLVREDLRRSLIMAPDGFPPGSSAPPTDGAFFHPAGVPIVQHLAAPMYLFDEADTPAMIHKESLAPVSRAAARLIAWTAGRTAAGMRAEVTPAP
jgi:hypothetical protein